MKPEVITVDVELNGLKEAKDDIQSFGEQLEIFEQQLDRVLHKAEKFAYYKALADGCSIHVAQEAMKVGDYYDEY